MHGNLFETTSRYFHPFFNPKNASETNTIDITTATMGQL